METTFLQKDQDLLQNVLMTGESVLWAEKTHLPKLTKLAIAFCFIFGVVSIIAPLFIPWASSGDINNANFFGFLLGALFILAGVYCVWHYAGEHYNIVTDIRVLTCHIKRGHSIRINQLPFYFMDYIDTISPHSLEFKTRQHKTSVKFEHVSDIGVENICREQLRMYSTDVAVKLAESAASTIQDPEDPVDVPVADDRKKAIEIPDHFRPEFRDVLKEVLEGTKEPEKLLWGFMPQKRKLLRHTIITHIMKEVVVIALSVWFMDVAYSFVFWAIFTCFVMFSFVFTALYSCLFGQAYAITDKSFIAIRKGFRPLADKQDHIIHKGRFMHSMRVSHRRLFPMFSTFKIGTGKGYVFLPVPHTKAFLTLADVREFHSVLFTLDKPSIRVTIGE